MFHLINEAKSTAELADTTKLHSLNILQSKITADMQKASETGDPKDPARYLGYAVHYATGEFSARMVLNNLSLNDEHRAIAYFIAEAAKNCNVRKISAAMESVFDMELSVKEKAELVATAVYFAGDANEESLILRVYETYRTAPVNESSGVTWNLPDGL